MGWPVALVATSGWPSRFPTGCGGGRRWRNSWWTIVLSSAGPELPKTCCIWRSAGRVSGRPLDEGLLQAVIGLLRWGDVGSVCSHVWGKCSDDVVKTGLLLHHSRLENWASTCANQTAGSAGQIRVILLQCYSSISCGPLLAWRWGLFAHGLSGTDNSSSSSRVRVNKRCL